MCFVIKCFCFSTKQTVCCENNHMSGLVVIGCSPSKNLVTWSFNVYVLTIIFNSQPCLTLSPKYLDCSSGIRIPVLLVSFISYLSVFSSLTLSWANWRPAVRPPARISFSPKTFLILIIQSGPLFYHSSHFDTLFRLLKCNRFRHCLSQYTIMIVI